MNGDVMPLSHKTVTCLVAILMMTIQSSLFSQEEMNPCLDKFVKEMIHFHGKEIEVKTFKQQFKQVISLDELFGKKRRNSEILIGVAESHVYLVVDNLRIDGAPFNRTKLRKNAWIDANSLILRFKNPPADALEKIKAYMIKSKGDLSLSCIGSVCTSLQKGGIKLKGHPITPVGQFKAIFKEGFVDKNGNPIIYEVYKAQYRKSNSDRMSDDLTSLDPEQIEKFFQNWQSEEMKNIGKQVFLILGEGALAFVIITSVAKNAPDQKQEKSQ